MATITSNYIASANESLRNRVLCHPIHVINEYRLSQMLLTAAERAALEPALHELRYQFHYEGNRDFLAAEYFTRDLPAIQETDPRFTGWRKAVKYFLFECAKRNDDANLQSLMLIDAATFIAAAFRIRTVEPIIEELRAIAQNDLDFYICFDSCGNEYITF